MLCSFQYVQMESTAVHVNSNAASIAVTAPSAMGMGHVPTAVKKDGWGKSVTNVRI